MVVAHDDMANRKLVISNYGPDRAKLGPSGYCRGPHMEIMPRLLHGMAPIKPLHEGSEFHEHCRTSQEDCHFSGDCVAVGHNCTGRFSEDDAEFLPEIYVGPVFGLFCPCDG